MFRAHWDSDELKSQRGLKSHSCRECHLLLAKFCFHLHQCSPGVTPLLMEKNKYLVGKVKEDQKNFKKTFFDKKFQLSTNFSC